MMSSEKRSMALRLPHDPDRCEALGTPPSPPPDSASCLSVRSVGGIDEARMMWVTGYNKVSDRQTG